MIFFGFLSLLQEHDMKPKNYVFFSSLILSVYSMLVSFCCTEELNSKKLYHFDTNGMRTNADRFDCVRFSLFFLLVCVCVCVNYYFFSLYNIRCISVVMNDICCLICLRLCVLHMNLTDNLKTTTKKFNSPNEHEK